MKKINFRIRFFLDKRIGQVMCRVRWNHSLCEVEFSTGVYAQEEKWNKDLQKAKIRTEHVVLGKRFPAADINERIGEIMQYDNTFKLEALKLSDEIGIRKAAAQLGIPYYTLADWRYIRKHEGESAFVGSGNKREPADEKDRRIQELEAELREAKRANEILKDALGFFAESRRK